MSKMGNELATRRPDWHPIPAELQLAWDWMEKRGFGADAPAGYVLTPYAGDTVLGPVFAPNLTLEGWFPDHTQGWERLLPIAEAAPDGSLVALWLDDAQQVRVVVLESEGTGYVIASSVGNFLILLAIGYAELTAVEMTGPPEDQDAVAAVAEYRAWVHETFDTPVPGEWPTVGDDDFSVWLDAHLGRETIPAAPVRGDRPGLDITGHVRDLLAVLGRPDGPDVAQAVGDIVGADVGLSLRASPAALRGCGIEVESDRHGVKNMWIDCASYPRPAHLIDGADPQTTMAEALAAFGEPERQGDTWLRYVVDGRLVHLDFAGGTLRRITAMAAVP